MSDELTIAPVPRLLLDRQGMAAALSISEDLLDGARKHGLPCIMVPGAKKVLFDGADVVAWLKAHGQPQEDRESLAAAEKRLDLVIGPRRRTG